MRDERTEPVLPVRDDSPEREGPPGEDGSESGLETAPGGVERQDVEPSPPANGEEGVPTRREVDAARQAD